MESFAEVAKALEAKFGEARKAKIIWKPQTTTMLDDETGEKMKADKTKHRVTVYYLVAEHTGTLAKLG